jgi:hypothetical protein
MRERVAFLQTYINKLAQPELLRVQDPRFSQVVEYVEWVLDQVPHTFRVEGNEVVVATWG